MDKELFKKASELHQRQQFSAAKKLYQKILEQEPKNPQALHAMAVLSSQQDDYADALDYINQAIEADKNNPSLHNSKGNILLHLKKNKDAATRYQQAIALDPNYAIAYNNLGRSLYLQNKLDAAEKAYKKAITLKPNYADAYYNLSLLLCKKQDFDAAINKLQKTILISPKFAAAYGQLGQVYLQKNDYQKAIDYLQKRLGFQPNHTDTQYDLGLALLHEHQNDQAIKLFEQVLMSNPKYPECNHSLATAYLQSADTGKALNYYFRQLEINPLPESVYNIGVLLMYQERHKEAVEYLSRSAEMNPGYLPAHLNLGALYLKMNRQQDAIKHYKIAAEIDPSNAEIKHILTALTQEETPEKAPSEYLEHLFDQYASHYDKHLTEYLHFTVPEQLLKAVEEESNAEKPQWTILDLGCGTGLAGELFKPFSKHLIGIDLSEKMLDVAKEKSIYDELKRCDVIDALQQFHDIDLIIASDVFTYIGNLNNVFKHAKLALKPDGYFAFSVEKTSEKDYILQQTIRYAHSEKYIRKLCEENELTLLRLDNIILRKQKNEPIEGYLVVLQRRLGRACEAQQ